MLRSFRIQLCMADRRLRRQQVPRQVDRGRDPRWLITIHELHPSHVLHHLDALGSNVHGHQGNKSTVPKVDGRAITRLGDEDIERIPGSSQLRV